LFKYLSSYRPFILTKCGLATAYLWFCWDLIRLNLALHKHLLELIPPLGKEVVCNDAGVNEVIIASLSLVSQPIACWIYLILSPIAVAIYLWGRFRWLQVGVAAWIWLSIVGLTAHLSVLMTTADFWLSWCFILYLVAGLITPTGLWEASQPSFKINLWRSNPTISSEYVFLLVILQFTVYFYAGLNKLIFGWTAWTSGRALQDLMYDPAMHNYVRGISLPYIVSFFLCYITLAQRLILPFGFFSMRLRVWAVVILGLMHLGYEAVMQVAIFPLIGISCLLVMIPPKQLAIPLLAKSSKVPPKQARKQVKTRKLHLASMPSRAPRLSQKIFAMSVVGLLLVEPAIMSYESSDPPYWNVKLATQLHWIMFADGGSASKERFKVRVEVYNPATGASHLEDATNLPLSYFPATWRTRLYSKEILSKALAAQHPGSSYEATDEYLENYINAAVELFRAESSPQQILGRFVLAIEPYNKKAQSQ